MRLPVNIFLWTFGATLLPVLALVWGVTTYSEHRFQAEVGREINDNIDALTGEINNRLRYEREVLQGIAKAPAIQSMLNALVASSKGIRHPELTAMRIRANAFLAGLQRTVPGLGSIRILDAAGNTMIKTTLGRVSSPMFDSLGQVNYVEEELENGRFLKHLKSLPDDEISFLMIPASLWEVAPNQLPSMLYAVIPLSTLTGKRAGYVVVNTFGEYLDQILELSPKLRNGKVMVIEHDPGDTQRDGLVLYNDRTGRQFTTPMESHPNIPTHYAQKIDQGRFWQTAIRESNGTYLTKDGHSRIYFQEYHPYPFSLVSWFMALRVPADVVSAPFRDIHHSLYGFAILALAISLMLAGLGARFFSRPITRLGQTLKRFADGERDLPFPANSRTHEVRQLQLSFKYMADHLNEEAQRRREAERQMLQQAKLASIGEMAAGIGHEINNPLNNILTLTRLIERQAPAELEDLRRDLVDLREEALRVSRIVRGVLNFARQLPPEHQTRQIDRWITEIVERMEAEAMEADVMLSVVIEQADCMASFDPGQIEQVVTNLVRNAIHVSPADGVVEIRTHCDPRSLTVTISDQGPGIAPDLLDRIFDPFFTTKSVDKGTGLGLSISLGIVQYHGGTLTLENREDRTGVVARMTLPRQKSGPRVGA